MGKINFRKKIYRYIQGLLYTPDLAGRISDLINEVFFNESRKYIISGRVI